MGKIVKSIVETMALASLAAIATAQSMPAQSGDLIAIVKEIQGKLEAHRSLTAKIEFTAEVDEQGQKRTVERGVGSCECSLGAGKSLYRWELKVESVAGERELGPLSRAGDYLTVSDGEFEYRLMQRGSESRAEKGRVTGPPWPYQSLGEIISRATMSVEGRGYDVAVLPTEQLQGNAVYVIEARYRTGQGSPTWYMPDRIRSYYQADSGLPLKDLEAYGDALVLSTTFTDIKVNPDIPAERFEFKLPAGATLDDRTGPAMQPVVSPQTVEEMLAPTRTIHYAARTGNLARIRECLQEGTDINLRDDEGSPPLYTAAKGRQAAAAEFLISAGADVNAHCRREESREEGIGMTLVHMGYDRGTALHAAAAQGDAIMVNLLLAHGADPNAVDNLKDTPLHLAVEWGHEADVVRALLAAGADVNARNTSNEDGKTPMQIAAEQDDERMLNLLKKKGVTPDPELDLMLKQELLCNAVQSGDVEGIQRRLAEGADVSEPNHFGSPPLCIAAETGNTAVVRLLLERGALIDTFDHVGNSPLMLAVTNGHKEMVELLLAEHADVNSRRDKGGLTALYYAVSRADATLVRLLLAHGAAVDLSYGDNGPVLHGDSGMVLHMAAKAGNRDIVQMLLEKGADPNRMGTGPLSRAPLDEAAFSGDVPTIACLVAHGAQVNAKGSGDGTALSTAALLGRTAAAQELLSHGAEVNAHDKAGRTALHLAAQNGHAATVELLLGAGADVDIRDKDGATALGLAKKNGHAAVVEMLAARGGKE